MGKYHVDVKKIYGFNEVLKMPCVNIIENF